MLKIVNKGSLNEKSVIVILLFVFVILCSGSVEGKVVQSDDILDEEKVVALAIEKNPYIKEANFNLLSQIESEKVAFASRLPKLELNYDYIYVKDKPYIIMDYQIPPLFPGMPSLGKIRETIPTGKNQSIKYNITAYMPIFTGFYLEELQKAEKIGIDVKKFIREALILDIAHTTKVAYYNVLIEQKLLEVAEKSVEQLEAHLKDAENLYKAGLIPYNDLLKVKVQLSKMKERRAEEEGKLRSAMTYLATLIQEDPLTRLKLKDVSSDSIVLPKMKLEKLIKIALSNRPEVKAHSLITKQFESYIKIAKSEYYPKVNVFVSYQRSGENLLATKNSYTNEENTIYGFTVKMNIFDFKKREHTVNRLEYEKLSQKEREKQITDRIKNEVVVAYNNLVVAYRNFETAKEALIQAEEDFRITKLQYSVNMAKAIEVIDSEKALTEARTFYYTSLYRYYMALSELMRACGIRDKNILYSGASE
ncbi:MAG: TolC family protein [Thermosulfidibacteraceae bacterium]|jgi:outer membrane protein TolC